MDLYLGHQLSSKKRYFLLGLRLLQSLFRDDLNGWDLFCLEVLHLIATSKTSLAQKPALWIASHHCVSHLATPLFNDLQISRLNRRVFAVHIKIIKFYTAFPKLLLLTNPISKQKIYYKSASNFYFIREPLKDVILGGGIWITRVFDDILDYFLQFLISCVFVKLLL